MSQDYELMIFVKLRITIKTYKIKFILGTIQKEFETDQQEILNFFSKAESL